MHRPHRLSLSAFLVLHMNVMAAPSAPDFTSEIRPILQKHCFECHGEKKQKGGLRMDRTSDLLRGGDAGDSFIPGKSAESEALHRILSKEEDERMPPKGDRVPAAEVALLRAWLDAGAPVPDGGADAEQKHWAYVPPQALPLPAVKEAAWPRNGIDHWVLARLEQEGLKPSPEADPAVLLRRVSLDLTGLPPTLNEVDAFLADRSPDAYARVVEQLLASSAYGERWARPWLDLARYADTQGFEKDNRRSMWPYRDWVIDALNRDLPFDVFTVEQIAGDLLPNATPAQKIATGFHRNTMTNTEGGTDNEEFRFEALVDRVNTTFSVWMGTTMACAQCHNHKYDPLLTREYYEAMAFLNHTADADRDDEAPTMKVFAEGQEEKLRSLRDAERVAEKRLADYVASAEYRDALQQWENSAAVQQVAWDPLTPEAAKADGGVTLTPQADGVLLATGANPAQATYQITVKTRLAGITAFRLEALVDPVLPDSGPGRSSAGNAILTEFSLTANGQPVAIRTATADFQQDGWPVAHAIDGNPQTGWAWAPRFGQPHAAIFTMAKAIAGDGEEQTLVFTLGQTNQEWAQHTLGKFRLSATLSPVDATPLPPEIAAAVGVPAEQRSEKQREVISAHFRKYFPPAKALTGASTVTKKSAEDFDRAIPVTSVMEELPKPRITRRHVRGAYLQTAEEGTAGHSGCAASFSQ